MKDQKILAIVYAIMAAVFYAVNIPLSKLLLFHIPAVLLAGMLYPCYLERTAFRALSCSTRADDSRFRYRHGRYADPGFPTKRA